MAGDVVANSIAKWDGISWSALGSGLGGSVYALAEYISGSPKLIAGGSFTSAGGQPANRIAQWDGSRWTTLANGIDDDVQALAMFNGAMIAGGEFTTVGGEASAFWASWGCYSTTGIPTNNLPHVARLWVSPNPSSGQTAMYFDLPREAHVRIMVFDVSGRLISRPVDAMYSAGRQSATWDGQTDHGPAVTGLYFVKLQAGDHTLTQRIALIR